MTQRIGFNVNGQRVNDEKRLLDFVKRAEPTTMLVMNNMDLALKIHNITEGKTQVVYRDWQEDDAAYWATKSANEIAQKLMASNLSSRPHQHIWKYVMNEPYARGNEWKKMSLWMSDIIKIMADAGHKAIVGNLSVGSYEINDVESGYFDPVLHTLGEYSNNAAFGIHEYTGFLLPFGLGVWERNELLDEAKLKPENWPNKIEDYSKNYVKNYYHLLRSTWFSTRAAKIGAKQHNIWLTEFGWDRMPDLTFGQNHIYEQLQNKYGVPNPYVEMRGAYTYANMWKKLFPQWSTSQSIFKQFEWADKIYPAHYIGFMPFMWSFGDDWDKFGFNYGSDDHLLELIVQYNSKILPPIGEPPVNNTPVDLGLNNPKWNNVYLNSTSSKTNIRLSPNVNASVVGNIRKNTVGLILIEGAKVVNGFKWYPVRINTREELDFESGDFSNLGWVRSDVFSFIDYVKPEPPAPIEDYDTIKISFKYKVTDEKQRAFAKVLEEISVAIAKFSYEIDLKIEK